MTLTSIDHRQHTSGATTTMVASAVGASAVAALTILVWWSGSPSGRYLDHAGTDHPTGLPMLATFVAAWLLMTVASMLPTALPLLTSFRCVVAGRRGAAGLVAVVVGGFLIVWTLAGVAMASIDLAVHQLVERTALGRHTWLIAVGALTLAGTYQLTPLAMRCLHACRSPLGFLGRHWTGAPDVRRQSLTIGLDYGLSCLGCCAGLMAVMFAVGMANPWWMVGLGVVSGAEKIASFGRELATATGVVLLVVAAMLTLPHLSVAG